MTISYTTATKHGSFFRLLFKWKGSVWKSVWRKLLLFIVAYATLSLVFRFALTPEQKEKFSQMAAYFDDASKRIPIEFILGFYVSQMVTRWWNQLQQLVWPDQFMILVTATIQGPDDDHMRRTRRTLARYINLACALVYREMSSKVIKRLPTMDHLVKCGLMTNNELEAFKSVEAPYGAPNIPLVWAANILAKCRKEGIIDSVQLIRLLNEIATIRICLGNLETYDWVPVPLIYTQVATLATYGYFLFCTIGRQYTDTDAKIQEGNHGDNFLQKMDMIVPIGTILQFVFYIGWLQVAEVLFNPFGEDDEDFEMNFLMDRNLAVSYLFGDTLHGNIGGIEEDAFWKQSTPRIPHTVASLLVKENYFKGHLNDFKLKEKYAAICDSDEQIENILRKRGNSNPVNKFRERLFSKLSETSISAISSKAGNKNRSQSQPFTNSEVMSTSALPDSRKTNRRIFPSAPEISINIQSSFGSDEKVHESGKTIYDVTEAIEDEEAGELSEMTNISAEIPGQPIDPLNQK